MCKDLFGTFLFSDVEVIFLQDIDGEFPLLVEEADAIVLVGVVVGFELLGVDVLERNEFKEVDGGVGISGA